MKIYWLFAKLGASIINFFSKIGNTIISLFSFIFCFSKRNRDLRSVSANLYPIIIFIGKTGDVITLLFLMPFRFAHHFKRIVIHGGKKVAVKRRTGNKVFDFIILFHYNTVSWLEKLDDLTYYRFVKKNRKKTHRSLTGLVESKGEKIIANWLYLNGIKAEYEKKLVLEKSKKTYYPDFYLPKYKIYIEFFGMEGAYDYTARREEKERHYRLHGIKYIGLFPKDVQNIKNLDAKLPEQIAQVSGKTVKIRRWKDDYLKWL